LPSGDLAEKARGEGLRFELRLDRRAGRRHCFGAAAGSNAFKAARWRSWRTTANMLIRIAPAASPTANAKATKEG
jgi:hypothetical protein